MKFLTVSGDPLFNFVGESVLGIRECYKDLKKILEDAEAGARFVVLGTSGIGKSSFSVFWVCHQAAKKKKVVWELFKQFYLLDFSGKDAKVYGPSKEGDNIIQEVLRDESAWLILDGGHEGGFACDCHVLVPCSDKKQNYKEFCKGQFVTKLYLPIWEEEEISQFLEAFDERRPNYEHMRVPSKEKAMEYFANLGGVARYVLCSSNTEYRHTQLQEALSQLDTASCLKMLKGDFNGLMKTRDVLVHTTCGPDNGGQGGKYCNPVVHLATSEVKSAVITAFDVHFKADTVTLLKELLSATSAGSYAGQIFECVGHFIFMKGGQFRRKRVFEDGRAAVQMKPVELSKLTSHTFGSLETLPKLEADTYYYPQAGNFPSIDAFLDHGRLIQFFRYAHSGKHGYKVAGLKRVDDWLKEVKYEVWACVPQDKYEETGFQLWFEL